jgi:hypothetical protein
MASDTLLKENQFYYFCLYNNEGADWISVILWFCGTAWTQTLNNVISQIMIS